ncbi:MAG: hypothetical protein LLG00_01925 [Planctomycetaceae bacterium]|nr:hypothetical protein [Planctomycetaceae bacterium]
MNTDRCSPRNPREAARRPALCFSRRSLRLIVAATLILCFANVADAQHTLLSGMLTAGRLSPNGRWLWFSIVNGRVVLRWTQLATVSQTTQGLAKQESFRFAAENNQPRLHYERSTHKDTLKVDVVGAGDDLHISRTPQKSKEPALDFRQVPGQPVVLTVGVGKDQKIVRAADLWALLIETPPEFAKELLPLLDMLRPGVKLADAVSEVETSLLEIRTGHAVADQSAWAALVRQLGDDSFSRREAADRELRSRDPATVAYLRRLDLSKLDAEQRFRIRRILEAATAQSDDDSPEQAAASLAGVPAVWLALLARPDIATRKAAARQLASLLGGPIEVDPVADPATQKQQREHLRQRIETK